MSEKFGPAYKQLRENRGYTVKEAAGNIITPTALRKFENGETSTSVDNCNLLLLSIGATWNDLLEIYQGPTVESQFRQSWIDINAATLKGDYYQAKKIARKAGNAVPENPLLEHLPEIILDLFMSKRFNNPLPIDKDNPSYQLVIDHLSKVDEWGDLEHSLFFPSLEFHNIEFIRYRISKYVGYLKNQPLDMMRGDRAILNQLIEVISYFSKNNYFTDANQLTEDLEEILSRDDCIACFYEKTVLVAHKAVNLLRQDAPEGLELARQSIKNDERFIHDFYTPQLSPGMNSFIDLIHQLNKTGKPFDPYDD